MDYEIPIPEEVSSESDVEVLQEVTSVPLETQIVTTSHNENPNFFIPSVTQSVSSETETNQNAGASILQSTSSATKDSKDADSSMSQSASSASETNKDAGQSTPSATETNQDTGQSTPSSTETNQNAGQSAASATDTNQDASQSALSTTETNCEVVAPTFELVSSTTEVNRDTTQEGASTLDGQQPALNDPTLPPNPPDYHDIIPIIDDGSDVPAPPPSLFRTLCFCFFGAYRLYYARKIRKSRYMLIFLVALLALPVSAIYMGLKYVDSCFVTPRTPFLLILMGILGLLLNILRIVTVISRSFKDLGVCEPPRIIAESTAIFILCLMIAEMFTYYQNIPVFGDPKNPLYCPELLHIYIFYINLVVPAIGIFVLLLHLPMKPVDSTTRRLQEAERGAFRQHRSVEGAPSEVYTAWIKPRRRRSRRNEENAEIRVSSSRRTEQTTLDGTVGDLQRYEGGVNGGSRVRWWDEAGAVSGEIRNHPWDEEGASGGPIGSQMCDEECAVDIPIGDKMFDDEGDVGGAVGGDWRDEGAVGGAIGGHRWDEEGAECGGFMSLLWDEEEALHSSPRNRESAAFRSRHREEVTERIAFRSHQRGEENPEDDFSGSRRWDEEGGGLRSRRWYEGTEETNEGGVRRKRKVSTRDDVNPRRTESTETVVRPLRNESSVESDAFGTRWNEYGARPKIKENVDCVPRAKSKEGTESGAKSKSKTSAEDSTRPRRNESSETADITLRNEEDIEINAFGNKRNVRNEGGVRPKNKVTGTIPKNKEDTESGDKSKRKGNTEAEMKEVAEGGALPQSEESTESAVTPKMKESIESRDRQKRKERTEDDDRQKRKERTEDDDGQNRKERTEDDD